MIQSFRNKETRKVFEREFTDIIPPELIKTAYRKLVWIHIAKDLQALKIPPGNRLELLRGDRAGQYSIRINDKYRICFLWRGSDAFEVEIVDYHK